MSRNSTHINCNQIAGTVNQGIWLNDCDPCVESAYQIPNITQWLRHRFAVTAGGTAYAGPISTGDIANAAVISQWDDVIGSNNAVQATGADQPVWNDADTNILFATSDNLDLTAVTYAAADDFVILAGFVPSVSGTYSTHAIWSGTGNDTVTITSSTTIEVKLNNVAQTITGPTLAGQTDCEMINVTLRRENGICQFFIAGVPWGPSFVWTGDYRVDTIGYDGTNSLDGKLATFMQFDRALTDKEIWCLDCYLCGDDETGEPVGCRIGHDKLDCNGDTDGSLTATFLGAASGSTITYLWNTGATTQTISSLGAGTYTCTLTSNEATAGTSDDVTTTCTANVTEPPLALTCTTTTVQPVYVSGVLSPATISVAVTGGWGTPLSNSNIVWTKDGSAYTPAGADYFNISTSVAGTYAYTVTDVNGCTCTGSVAITIPGDPTLEITCGHTPIECHDETAAWGVMFDPSTTFNTTASITMVGSVSGAHAQSPISVSSLPASSTNFGQTGNWWLNTVFNQRLAAGETWTITVTDTGSPVRTAQCTIVTVNPDEIVINESISQPTACEGLNWSNGALSFVATGGTAPFTYEIEKTTATTSTIATNVWLNPGAGNYTLKATDANGCVVTKNVTITCPMDPMITISHTTVDLTCYGVKPGDGSATFTPSATTSTGYKFQLEVFDPSGVLIYDSGFITPFNAYTLSNLWPGTYTYNFTAKLDASGALTPLASNVSFTINEPPVLTLSAVITGDECHGAPGTGAIDITVGGGTPAYTYAWTASNGGAIPTGQATNEDLTALIAGSYTVIVTDSKGCTISRGWDVGQPCELDTTLSADPIECGDDGNGVEYVCNWELMGSTIGLGQAWASGAGWDHERATFTNSGFWVQQSPASYTCWHGYTDGVNHVDYPNLNTSTTFTPIVYNGTATCNVQFQANQGMYQWLTGLTIGETYNFSINVGTGTTASSTWKMAVYTIDASGNLTILGSETNVTSTGVTSTTFTATATEHVINVHFDGVAGAGSSAAWNQVLNTIAFDQGFGHLGAGLAMSEDGKTILTASSDQQEIITYKMCYNSTGSYPYTGGQWKEADRSQYKNGNAMLGKRENVGLSHDGTKMIIGDQFWNGNEGRVIAMTWNVSDAPNCEGYWEQMGANFEGGTMDMLGTVAISGDGTVVAIGSPGHDGDKGEVKVYTYNSGTSAWVQRGSTLDGPTAGEKFGFSIALSDDGAELVVGSPEHDWQNAQTTGIKGTVRVYEWGGSSWAQKGADIDGASDERFGHSVTIDGTGAIIGASSAGTVASNYKGVTRVYTYASSSWSQTGADMVGEGINDRSGNQVKLNTAGDIIVIGAAENDPTALIPNAGHIRVYKNVSGTWTQQGGDIDHSLSYDEFAHDVDINGAGLIVVGGMPYYGDNYEGGFTVHELVTTSNGASGVGCLQYVSVTGQSLTSNTTDINVSTLCGTPGYTYAWTTPTASPQGDLGSNSATSAGPLQNVPAGTYQVVTTDANGCTDTASLVIPAAGNITNSIVVISDAGCDETRCNGSLASATQFPNILTYEWTTDAAYTTPVTGGVGANQFNITEQCAGTYYLRVTLDNGCIWEGSGTITGGTSNMTLSAVVTDADMCDDCCGDIDLSVAQTPSAAPYTYAWSNGQTTQDLSCVSPGNYTVIVTDDNGCTETATYTVGVSNYAITFALYGIPTASQLGVSALSGGTPPYSYQWTLNGTNYASGTTSTTTIPALTVSQNGTYCLKVYDDKGCEFTDCYGVDFVTRGEIEEFNCRPTEKECTITKIKENVGLGTCAMEVAGMSQADLSGDKTTMAVGSSLYSSSCAGAAGRTDQPNLVRNGRVRIYRANAGGTWTQLGQDLLGVQNNEKFGQDVSLSEDGNTVAIGAHNYNYTYGHIGRVVVYDYSATIDEWIPRPQIIGGEGDENFGYFVSLSGDGLRVAAGARDHTVSGSLIPDAGTVRVYDYASSTWTQKGVDIDCPQIGGYLNNNVSRSVALSKDGTTLVIGSPEINGSVAGVTRVYRWSSSAWTQIGADITMFAHTDSANAWAGGAVACSTNGDWVIIGAKEYQDPSDRKFIGHGAAQVYKYVSSAWVQQGSTIIGERGEYLGHDVDMSGDGETIIIGRHGYDGTISSSGNNYQGTAKGRATIYKWIDSAWDQTCEHIEGLPGENAGKRVSMSTDGTRVSLSAPCWGISPSLEKAGEVRVYDVAFTAAGSSNVCIPCYTSGCGSYSTMALCLAACAPSESWKCVEGRCIDPGDGSGGFATEQLCLDSGCTTLKTMYDCREGGCVSVQGIGTYATLAACQTACGDAGQHADEFYCEILCPDTDEAETYHDEDTEEYDSPVDGEREERRERETATGGGRCRVRKDVSPETGSTTYYSTLELCQEACPWCTDVSKYDDMS